MSVSVPSFVDNKRAFFRTENLDQKNLIDIEAIANKNFRFLTQNRESFEHELRYLHANLKKNGNNRKEFWLYCYYTCFSLKTYYATYSPGNTKFKEYEKLCEELARGINNDSPVDPRKLSLLEQLGHDLANVGSIPFSVSKLRKFAGDLNMARLHSRFSMITVKLSLLTARQYQLLNHLEWLIGRQINIAILDAPLGIYNALSVGLFAFRFFLQLAMIIKHTFFPQGEEASLTMGERFYEEFKKRHFMMMNDLVWGVVNALCNYGEYFRIAAPVANGLMLGFTVFDLAWLGYLLYSTEKKYGLKRQEIFDYRETLDVESMAWAVENENLKQLELNHVKDIAAIQFYMLGASLMIVSFTVGFMLAPPVFLPLCFFMCNIGIAMYLSGEQYGEWRGSHLAFDQESNAAATRIGMQESFNNLVCIIVKNTVTPLILLTVLTLNVPAAVALTAAYIAYESGYFSRCVKKKENHDEAIDDVEPFAPDML